MKGSGLQHYKATFEATCGLRNFKSLSWACLTQDPADERAAILARMDDSLQEAVEGANGVSSSLKRSTS